MSLRDNPDAGHGTFWLDDWDVETHPGFALSYDVHRGRKFIALDNHATWFQRAVSLQRSQMISPHELVEKIRVKLPGDVIGKLSHVTAQIAVEAVALHKARARALEIGFSDRGLDYEVGPLADEWSIRPGKDMLRYLALMLGGYSTEKTTEVMKRMAWWGKWRERDIIEAFLGNFFLKAQEFIANGDVPGLARFLEEQSKEAEGALGATAAAAEGDDDESSLGNKPLEPVKGMVLPEVPSKFNLFPCDTTAWWGKMQVIQPPLVASQEITKKVYVRTATDIGTCPSDVSRILTDQRVFRESRPTIKGSVLIDASGSMNLSHQEIYKICAEIPGAIIGVYTGYSHSKSGKLIVAAINGRILEPARLAKEREGTGANVVDGPALEWLSSQPRPRVWVSDGHVTGVGESQHGALHEDADRLMRNGHIVRIRALKTAPMTIKYLRARKGVAD